MSLWAKESALAKHGGNKDDVRLAGGGRLVSYREGETRKEQQLLTDRELIT
jgi:hypothetical protein